MRLAAAAVALGLAIASSVGASTEVPLCVEWRAFDRNTKADFIVAQSASFLMQWKAEQWIALRGCFQREAPGWVSRIDEVCSGDEPAMDFDLGASMGALVATVFAHCSVELRSQGG